MFSVLSEFDGEVYQKHHLLPLFFPVFFSRILFKFTFKMSLWQGFAYLPAGVCVSSMGRPVSYEQAIAWKVLDEEDSNHCLAFMFMNWSFL